MSVELMSLKIAENSSRMYLGVLDKSIIHIKIWINPHVFLLNPHVMSYELWTYGLIINVNGVVDYKLLSRREEGPLISDFLSLPATGILRFTDYANTQLYSLPVRCGLCQKRFLKFFRNFFEIFSIFSFLNFRNFYSNPISRGGSNFLKNRERS